MNDELHDLLDSFTILPPGFFDYNSIPVDPRAVAKAKEMLAALPGYPWQAVPGGDGSLQLELHTKEFDIEILIEAVKRG